MKKCIARILTFSFVLSTLLPCAQAFGVLRSLQWRNNRQAAAAQLAARRAQAAAANRAAQPAAAERAAGAAREVVSHNALEKFVQAIPAVRNNKEAVSFAADMTVISHMASEQMLRITIAELNDLKDQFYALVKRTVDGLKDFRHAPEMDGRIVPFIEDCIEAFKPIKNKTTSLFEFNKIFPIADKTSGSKYPWTTAEVTLLNNIKRQTGFEGIFWPTKRPLTIDEKAVPAKAVKFALGKNIQSYVVVNIERFKALPKDKKELELRKAIRMLQNEEVARDKRIVEVINKPAPVLRPEPQRELSIVEDACALAQKARNKVYSTASPIVSSMVSNAKAGISGSLFGLACELYGIVPEGVSPMIPVICAGFVGGLAARKGYHRLAAIYNRLMQPVPVPVVQILKGIENSVYRDARDASGEQHLLQAEIERIAKNSRATERLMQLTKLRADC